MRKSVVHIAGIFVLLLIAFSACKKTGVNQNLNPDDQKPVDFMSTKKGSYWRYGTAEGEHYTRYATERDSVVNGLTYSYYERKDDTTGSLSSEFFGKNGIYHLTLVDMDVSGGGSYLEYAFWKDSAVKGDSWNNVGTFNTPVVKNIQVLLESYQTDDHMTMSWGGNTFTDVVHVHSDAKATGLNMKIGTLDIWFVKGLGVIREEANIDVSGFYTKSFTDSLLSYHIEP